MFDRWQRASQEALEIDLLPVMNLFMVLIPFLLMGAAFYHVGVIPTSVPMHTPQESDVPKTPKTVSINLVIDVGQIEVTASSTSLTEEELAEMAGSFPMGGSEYDTSGVVKHLQSIKAQYPMSKTMIVLPHETLAYEALVKVLDAVRDTPTGRMKDGEELRAELFPVVVFSRLLKAEPEVEGAEGEGAAEAVEGAP